MEIHFPKLTGYQQKVYDYLDNSYGSGKTAVVKSVRQSGKSFLSMVILLTYALKQKCRSIYIAPTLIQCMITYKGIVKAIQGTSIFKSCNGLQMTIEFSNGSDILFRSTAQGTSLRGLTASGILVLDECAFLSDDDINVILPFTNAHNSPMLCISTPFTQTGYFYNVYNRGLTKTDKLISFDWSKEPETERFLTPERKEFYKQTMERHLYRTEILGEFMTDDGMLFKNIQKCISETPIENTDGVYIGIDFGAGTGNDFTAISVMSKNAEQIDIRYDNKKSPMEIVDWLANIINRYNVVNQIFAEVNSIGNVYIDALQKKIKHKITKFTTTNKSKKDLVTTLQIALENETVKLKNDEQLIIQLNAYEMQISKNGTITYNGRSGIHDDLVMATMLSLYSLRKNNGKYNIKFI